MATAASARLKATDGWSQVPNSIIENQHIFTPAEFSLALVIVRKANGGSSPVMVSDTVWEAWTGRNSRMKEYAVKGLLEKGFRVDGRGEKARFSFHREQWEQFVRSSQRSKPHTIGRPIGVTPKPGSKIHPACADSGCAMMARDRAAENGLTLLPATQLAQPVAQTGDDSGAGAGRGKGSSIGLSALSASPVAQPVAQTDGIEQAWPATLAKLREFFPLVGPVFLARLVSTACAAFRGVTDGELGAAVQVAWNHKRKTQKAEGLFLVTVPDAIAALRRAPKPLPAPDLAEGGGRLLGRVAAEEPAGLMA